MPCLARYLVLAVTLLGSAGSWVCLAEPLKSNDFVFEAEPPVVTAGETAVLHWSIKGATKVLIEEGSSASRELHKIGEFGGTGRIEVRPQEDTIYVISCEGSTTYSCASLTIRVQVKSP